MTIVPDAWPRLMPIETAARYLGISRNHFLAHVKVPAVRLGRAVRWDRAALDRWVDSLGGQVSADALRNEILGHLDARETHDRPSQGR